MSGDSFSVKRSSSDSRYSSFERAAQDIGEFNRNSEDSVSKLKKYVGDHSRSSSNIHATYIKQMAQAKQNAASDEGP